MEVPLITELHITVLMCKRLEVMKVPDGITPQTAPESFFPRLAASVKYKKYVPWAECCVRHLGPEYARLLINEVRDTTKSTVHRGRLVDLLTSASVVLHVQ